MVNLAVIGSIQEDTDPEVRCGWPPCWLIKLLRGMVPRCPLTHKQPKFIAGGEIGNHKHQSGNRPSHEDL